MARALSWPWFGRLSEASFGLFALQMPVGVWFALMTLRSAEGTTAQLVVLIATTLVGAILWTEVVQRPLLQRHRRSNPAPSVIRKGLRVVVDVPAGPPSPWEC
jgi:peptidoglycan/LPS O-acetylase OafA/YrhL